MSSSNLDSKETFKARAKLLGASDDEVRKMEELGVDTVASFAFGCQYRPNQPDETPLLELVRNLTESADVQSVPPSRIPLYRRLHFECFTLVAADMRRTVESSGEVKPTKLAAPERAARSEDQSSRLKGLRLQGEMEPSHHLVDLAIEQWDSNVIRYIEWSSCTTRQQEVDGHKTNDSWKICPDAGVLKITKETSNDDKAQLNTDLRLRYALQRRGLAYDQAGILSFEIHEKWIDFLLEHRLQKPPKGYAQVTWEQLMAADKELFKRVAEDCKTGIRPLPSGDKPVEKAFDKWSESTRVTFLLLPLRETSSSSSSTLAKSGQSSESEPPSITDSTRAIRPQVQRTISKKGKGKGKGRGKSKQSPKLPEALQGCRTQTNNGAAFCWPYNLNNCSEVKPGQYCGRGFHGCMWPKCGKLHPVSECPLKAQGAAQVS